MKNFRVIFVCTLLYSLLFLISLSYASNIENLSQKSTLELHEKITRNIEHGEYWKAKKVLISLLNQQEKTLGEKHFETIKTQIQLANVFYFQESLGIADDLVKKSIEALSKTVEKDNFLLLKAKFIQAKIFIEKIEIEKAHELLKETLSLQEKTLGKNNKDVLKTRIAFLFTANSYVDKEDSIKMYKECINDVKNNFKNNEFLLTDLYFDYAKFLYSIGNLKEAPLLLTKHHLLMERKHGIASPQALMASKKISSYYIATDNFIKAKVILKNDLTKIKKKYGENNEHYINTLFKISLNNVLNKDMVNSIQESSNLLERMRKLYGDSDSKTINMMHATALFLRHYGDLEKAESLIKEAIQHAKNSKYKDNMLNMMLYISLASVYSSAGNKYEKNKIITSLNNDPEYKNTPLPPDLKAELLRDSIRKKKLIGADGRILESRLRDMHKDYEKLKNIYESQVKEFGPYNRNSTSTMYYLISSAVLMKNFDDAQNFFETQLSNYTFTSGFNSHDVAITLANMAMYIELDNPSLSELYYKLAILSMRMIRDTNKGLKKDLLQTYKKRVEGLYALAIEHLYTHKKYKEIFATLSIMKETELDDFLLKKNTNIDIKKELFTPQEQKFLVEFLQCTKEMQELGKELVPLEFNRATSLKAREDDYIYMNSIAKLLKSKLKLLFLSAQTNSQIIPPPEHAEAFNTSSNIIFLRKILSKVKGNGIFFYPVITQDRLYSFALSKDALYSYAKVVSKQEIVELVNSFANALKNPTSDIKPIANKLYKLILEPFESAFNESQSTTILFSLDGVLRYIPMSALHDGTQWLVEKYDIINFTDATKEQLISSNQKGENIAALGVTQAISGFTALPSVATEIAAIVNQGDSFGVLKGNVFLDEDFTYQSFTHVLNQKTPLIHIASHFVFNPVEQKKSFLLLGNGEKLTMENLFSKNMNTFEHIDLLTLSACETGAGIKKGDGREIESFGAIAQHHGAKSVIATLWPVADMSTAIFMQEFYREKSLNKISKSTSLAKTQRRFLRGEITAEKSITNLYQRGKILSSPKTPLIKKIDWSHPFFWAPFILMGDWQ